MKIKAFFLLLIFLTLQISSVKALSLNDRIEAAAAWISNRKTLNPKGFLNTYENKLYVEENALIFLALTLHRKTFTSNRFNEEIQAALNFILSSQDILKKDYHYYYDLNINAWGPSGKLFYWNAYVVEALSYSAFQLRFYGNLNESEIVSCNQAIASVKSFLNAWGNCQKEDGSWIFEYENKTGAELSENSALLTSLLYLALYEHFWGNDLNALKKYVESAEKTLDWILSLQELNSENWGYGGFYQNKEKNLQDTYSNAKAAFALNSYLRVIPSLKEDFKLKYYKVRDSLTLWVKEFVEKMIDEYYGVYNSRGLFGIIKYPKGLSQALMITTLVETWIDIGDLKYRDLAEKMLNWVIGENEVKKDLQSSQGGFYEGIQKNQLLINRLSLTTTALTLTALINCVLIGVPEIPFIQPILTLTLMASLLIIIQSKRFKK